MLKNLKEKKGFASVIEVIITAIIFTFAAVGIFTALSSLRPHGADSARRLEAAYVGKQVVEELRSQVDARTWSDANSLLSPGPHSRTVGHYTINYYISDVPGLELREMQMNVFDNNP